MASTVVSALFGSYDLRNAKQWRDEDMTYRDQEVQWLNDDIVRAHTWRLADIERSMRRERLESEHIVCDARAEQLWTVTEQCTLFCGFTVAGMCNVGLPADPNDVLLFAFGVSAAAVCVTLLLCALMCTHLLLAVTRYQAYELEARVNALDVHQIETSAPFGDWWLRKCEREQMVAHRFMLTGIALFFLYLGVVVWFQFGTSSTATPTSMSALALVGFLVWQLRIASKWRYLLAPPSSGSTVSSYSSYSSSLASARSSAPMSARSCFDSLVSPKTPLPGAAMATLAHRKLSMNTSTAATSGAGASTAATIGNSTSH